MLSLDAQKSFSVDILHLAIIIFDLVHLKWQIHYSLYILLIVRYKYLDMMHVGTAMSTVVRKCLLDQILMSPYTWLFMSSVWYITKPQPYPDMDVSEGVKAYVKRRVLPSYLVGLYVLIHTYYLFTT